MTDPLLTYDLRLVQSQTYQRTFSWRLTDAPTYANLHLWDFYSQVRTKEDPTSDLMLDLTQYMTISDAGGTGRSIDLYLPGEATSVLDVIPFKGAKTCFWDLFLVLKADRSIDQLLVEGLVYMNPATTDVRTVEV